jgi:transcription initiation factor TFIIB
MTSALDLPRGVREEAAMCYRRAQAEQLIQGRSIETMAAGSLYAACRCRGYPRSPTEIAAVARCSAEKVRLGYSVLNTELGLETAVVGVRDRIPKLATECDASALVRHRALEFAMCAEEAGLANGRNPSGFAAACLYLAGREYGSDHTQADLARLADVTPTTLRARYYELRDAAERLSETT